MTSADRSALLLAARLLESGIAPSPLDLGDDGGHVAMALTIADRLRAIEPDPEATRQMVASLRSAAREAPAVEGA